MFRTTRPGSHGDDDNSQQRRRSPRRPTRSAWGREQRPAAGQVRSRWGAGRWGAGRWGAQRRPRTHTGPGPTRTVAWSFAHAADTCGAGGRRRLLASPRSTLVRNYRISGGSLGVKEHSLFQGFLGAAIRAKVAILPPPEPSLLQGGAGIPRVRAVARREWTISRASGGLERKREEWW